MLKFITILIMVCGLTSCANAPPIQYYSLNPIAHKIAQNINKTDNGMIVGVGPVTIPSLLDRKKIITRGPDNSIQIAEFHQWAAPIQDNFTETLVNNLTRLEPSLLFRAYPWSLYGLADIQIIVDVQQFDAIPGKSVNLEARWTIKNEKTQAVLKNGRSVLQQPLTGSSYPAVVQGLNAVLGMFSQELCSALSGMEFVKG